LTQEVPLFIRDEKRSLKADYLNAQRLKSPELERDGLMTVEPIPWNDSERLITGMSWWFSYASIGGPM